MQLEENICCNYYCTCKEIQQNVSPQTTTRVFIPHNAISRSRECVIKVTRATRSLIGPEMDINSIEYENDKVDDDDEEEENKDEERIDIGSWKELETSTNHPADIGVDGVVGE